MNKKKLAFWGLSFCVIASNFVVFNHAYRFTHFKNPPRNKTGSQRSKIESLSGLAKLKTLFLGIEVFKETQQHTPEEARLIWISSRKEQARLATWLFPVTNSQQTILLFHGYGGSKNRFLPEAQALQALGYQVLAVDFSGHGDSEGNQVSLGYHEAEDVEATYKWAKRNFPDQRIVLYAASMGAAAVLRALHLDTIRPEKVVLECPFASMQDTIRNRFALMGLPTKVFPEWLMLWGSLQNRFWAFGHKPSEYAKSVDTPLLLMWGAKDLRVSNHEINKIFENIPHSEKKLKIFPELGHQSYCQAEFEEWKNEVTAFLNAPKR
jgi:uncharacterized protein